MNPHSNCMSSRVCPALTQSCLEARFPNVQGVASGAILSDYQRFRVENVYVHRHRHRTRCAQLRWEDLTAVSGRVRRCERLGLVSLAYLWQRDQKELLQEMTEVPIDAVLIKVRARTSKPDDPFDCPTRISLTHASNAQVAALGLDPYKHLGKSITALRPLLFRLVLPTLSLSLYPTLRSCVTRMSGGHCCSLAFVFVFSSRRRAMSMAATLAAREASTRR